MFLILDIMDYNSLRKLVKGINTEGFPNIKIAFLGNYSNQFLTTAIERHGRLFDLNIETFEGGYNQTGIDILSPDSELYNFNPEFVFLGFDSKPLKNDFNKLSLENKSIFGDKFLAEVKLYVKTLSGRMNTKIIFANFIEEFDDVFNFLASKNTESFSFQLQRINVGLSELSIEFDNLFIMDLKGMAFRKGRSNVLSNKLYVNTSQPYDLNFIPVISKSIIDLVTNFRGSFSKCLILDLDNTLWGGVIGDDGMNNIEIGDLGVGKIFTEIQLWAKALKERGIILCICSKNTEEIAKEPFEQMDEMILKLNDISVFVANWNNKADNIRYIQKVLNIGFDSMVFVDDNPAERDVVRNNIEGIIVPELPSDPENYLTFLNDLNLFSTVTYSGADQDRTDKYIAESERVKFSEEVDIDSYLNGLEMQGECVPISDTDVARVAQLTQRSNQFNLRTIRQSEADISDYINNPSKLLLKVSLKDKFGAYGLIGVIILDAVSDDEYFITNWIMSCRVLKRGVEKFTFNSICDTLISKNIKVISSEYCRTKKNNIVSSHYSDLGFEEGEKDKYSLALSSFSPLGHSIKVY